MQRRIVFLIPSLLIGALFFTSCSKEPVVGAIEATVEGYKVTFKVTVTHADTYLWNFGDDKTSTEAGPVHTYAASGNYTVTVTVSGKGGEAMATKEIEVLPSVAEMLSGDPLTATGKTWVLSSGFTEGVNGGGAIDNSMTVVLPTVEDVLAVIGLPDEYDNEFTFFPDGRYAVDVKNGIALTGSLYGVVNSNILNFGNEFNNLGIYGGTFTAPPSASWALHEEDLVVDAITNPLGTEVPAAHQMMTITGRNWVTISGDAFFGILDFSTTRKFIIKDITPDKMEVALFVCGYIADPNAWTIPAYLFHLTYIPKK